MQNSALLLAAQNGKVHALMLLLDNGAKINQQNKVSAACKISLRYELIFYL